MVSKKLNSLCLNYASKLVFCIRVIHERKICLALVLQYPVIQLFCQKQEADEELILQFYTITSNVNIPFKLEKNVREDFKERLKNQLM